MAESIPEEDPHDSGPLRRSATAPQRRSRLPSIHRSDRGTSASRSRGLTVTSRIRHQQDPTTDAHRSPTFGRTVTRESDRLRRIAEEERPPRQSTNSSRPRHSESVVRRRRTTATGRPRGPTVTSVRSVAYSTSNHQHGDSSFSLAGGPQEGGLLANQPYVHPAYTDLNPAYENPANARPVWGLAKPLPRVVRPGMVPSVNELRENIVTQHQGGQPEQQKGGAPQPSDDIDLEDGREEPTLKLGRIASQVQQARERRDSRLLARIIPEQLLFRTATSTEHKQPLTPPSELAEDAEYEHDHDHNHEHDDASATLSPFPKLDDVAEDGETSLPLPLQQSNDVDASGLARQTTVRFDDENVDDASTVNGEDFKDDPDLIEYELKKMEELEYDEVHNYHTNWSVIRARFREPLAELLAVIVQLTIGFCADLTVVTSSVRSGNDSTTAWAWGLATMLGVYIAGGISGAHLNPAISITLSIYRGFPWRKLPSYVFAQVLGGFLAALMAYGLYRTNILAYDGTADLASGGTVGAFLTYPRFAWIDPCTAFFNEFTGTAFLAIAVLALGDDSNAPPGAGMSAFIIGLVVTALSMAFGYSTGAAMNPSRDFGPRLALWVVGYGGENLFGNGYFVYGPWIATILGAVVGAGVYDVAVFVGGESPVNYPRARTGKKRGGLGRKLRRGVRGSSWRVGRLRGQWEKGESRKVVG